MIRAGVLDYGMGNLRSVAKALERAGADVRVDEGVDPTWDALVVPGQGAFGSCVRTLGPDRLDAVASWIRDGRAYLGICLGLQILLDGSEEDPSSPGAGVLAGAVRRLPPGVKQPHIGWNDIRPAGDSSLFGGIEAGERFYFVHSYYADPADAAVVSATAEYGARFACAVSFGAAHATQFHPEKSGEAGQRVLRNFLTGAP